MEAPGSMVESIQAIQSALEGTGYQLVIVGALATFAWGDARTTRDVDLVVRGEFEDLRKITQRLQADGLEVTGPLSTAFGPRLLISFPNGVDVDLFVEAEPGLFDRAQQVELGGIHVLVEAAEDLIARKLENAEAFPEERSRDLEDAAGVVAKMADDLDGPLLEALCRERGVSRALGGLLESVGQGAD